MLCDIELKKVEIDHRFYFAKTRLFCPFCKACGTHKTRKYDSLKSLEYHLAQEHQTDRTINLTITEVNNLMKIYALSMQIGMLECDQENLQCVRPAIFPKIRKFFDEQ